MSQIQERIARFIEEYGISPEVIVFLVAVLAVYDLVRERRSYKSEKKPSQKQKFVYVSKLVLVLLLIGSFALLIVKRIQ